MSEALIMAENSDLSIVVIGDNFFKNLFYRLTHEDVGIDQLPLILELNCAPVSVLFELERFICNRSLLIVHLGRWDISKADNDGDIRGIAEELAQHCGRLKKIAPDLTIVVYTLPQSSEDSTGKYSAASNAQHNRRVDAFNERLREILNRETAILASFDLNDRANVFDKAGWDPNAAGLALVAKKISQVIREHRSGLNQSRIPSEYYASCDTLIVGDRKFSGIREHLPDDIGDAVVVTAREASTHSLWQLSLLVGECNLKHCIVYLGMADILTRNTAVEHEPSHLVERLYSAARLLKIRNPECKVIMCLLVERFFEVPSKVHTGRQAAFWKVCNFNHCLLSKRWQYVCELGLMLNSDAATVAQRVAKIVVDSRQ